MREPVTTSTGEILVPLQDAAATALEAGVHPRDVRRQVKALTGRSVRVEYTPHQSTRETARRARQLNLCGEGCGRFAPKTRTPRICDDCLAAKWAE